MFLNALRMSHKLLEEVIQDGDCVVDATMGNGNDTLFLSRLVGESGKVLSFDVQEQAIQNTQKRLRNEKAPENTQLILKGHEYVADFLNEDIKAAVFNLGFLPKSDEKIITQKESTLTALEVLTQKLVRGGRICVVLYYGHEGGIEEKEAVEKWVKGLSSEDFCVLRYEFYNQVNQPPILLCIERK